MEGFGPRLALGLIDAIDDSDDGVEGFESVDVLVGGGFGRKVEDFGRESRAVRAKETEGDDYARNGVLPTPKSANAR